LNKMAEYEAFRGESVVDDRVPCSICSRKFMPESLGKHEPICAKSNAKKRKVFDSAKHRAAGTDIKLAKDRPKPGAIQPAAAPKSNWREEHEDFIRNIRAARGAQHAMKTGAPLPPPPPAKVPKDYVHCDYCDRNFNATAAERHIPFCREKSGRVLKNMPTADAKARREATLKYKAPRLKPKTMSPSGGMSGPGGGYGDPGSTMPARSAPRGPSASSKYGGTIPSKSATPGGRGPTTGGPRRVTAALSSSSSGQSSPAGYDPYGKEPERSYTTNAARTRAMQSSNKYQASNYEDDPDPGYSSGKALRTGRNQQTLSAGKNLHRGKQTPNSLEIHGSGGSRAGSSSYRGQVESPIRTSLSPMYSPENTPSPPAVGRPHSAKHRGRIIHEPHVQTEEHLPSMGRVGSAAKFCHECGTKFPVPTAKFCCECGVKRVKISQ
ncbi:unnamed protein product, partial [Owenia fusiformis]